MRSVTAAINWQRMASPSGGRPLQHITLAVRNAWSPAVEKKNQINAPIFRLLGQDPVYYYDNQIPKPDTMEPVWPSGRSQVFVDRFLAMIADSPTLSLAYAQLGQENSFGWPEMVQAFPMQMDALALVQRGGKVRVETMGETGRRFKRSFSSTPAQAQVMLEDPFGKDDPPQRTVWYQSGCYRANLHFVGEAFYLRDLHVYSDAFPQPYLTEPVRQHGIEQRLLAVLDGYHWSEDAVRAGGEGLRAKGTFSAVAKDGSSVTLLLQGLPTVQQEGDMLSCIVPLAGGGQLWVQFHRDRADFSLEGRAPAAALRLDFEWVGALSSYRECSADSIHYVFREFGYTLRLPNSRITETTHGVRVTSTSGPGCHFILRRPRDTTRRSSRGRTRRTGRRSRALLPACPAWRGPWSRGHTC